MSLPQRSPATLPRPAYGQRPSPGSTSPTPRPAVHAAAAAARWQHGAGPVGPRPAAPRPATAPPTAQRPAARAAVTFLTVAEVAAIMRVSKMTVYRLVHGGELAAVRVGRSFRVPEPAVRAYLLDARTDVA